MTVVAVMDFQIRFCSICKFADIDLVLQCNFDLCSVS